MTKKGKRNLVCLNACSVICNADQLFAAVCDLHRNSRGSCVNGIFHKLFYNRGRAFHHFSCRDLVNGILV